MVVNKEILAFIIILCSGFLLSVQSDPIFNVCNFGAVGDGKTDDSQAFAKAWTAMCTANGEFPTLLIPDGQTFMLKPTTFSGPCTSPEVHVQVLGTLAEPSTIPEWDNAHIWLEFRKVDGLTVDGSGLIGGQGAIWWPCRTKPDVTCKDPAPTALQFSGCNGLKLDGLHLYDNPRNHLSLAGCNGARLSNLDIRAPENSPNTDGIDLSNTNDVEIFNSTIATGDDCIAINNNTNNANISYITCGPGHGISVGSLGQGGSVGIVEQIHVSHCTFIKTENGARIKTWEGGSGYVKGVSFEDLTMDSVHDPIVINQNYVNNENYVNDLNLLKYSPTPGLMSSSIEVSDVSFKGVRGTSTVADAVQLLCSESAPCTDIVVSDVQMSRAEGGGDELVMQSSNANGPPCCDCNPPAFC